MEYLYYFGGWIAFALLLGYSICNRNKFWNEEYNTTTWMSILGAFFTSIILMIVLMAIADNWLRSHSINF